ncbi:hypothetical protein Smic_27570 [Streptomyces microflavus]|uniref:Uncharacterized protein n=1 Tax=Streptomyces microflavus TaxID=1919 RepID=A0A7J0CNX9_STRMI|nr:hypothetical protein Smic_27570 [Streptomyces microflavus]
MLGDRRWRSGLAGRPGLPSCRPLSEQDRGHHSDRARALRERQTLLQEEVSEDGGGERAGEAEKRHGQGGEPFDTAEPHGVGEQSTDEAEVGESREVRPGQTCGKSLTHQGHRGDQQTAHGELPSGEGEQPDSRRAAPALGQDDARRHAQRAAETGGHPDRVKSRLRSEDQHAHAGRSERTCADLPAADRRAQQQRGQQKHEDRLDGADQSGDTSGQVVRGDEEQVEEDADVQGSQCQDPPPPVALRELPPRQGEDQPARQGAYRGGEQRAVRRKELGGHQIGAAPYDRGQDGECGVES